MSILWKLWSFHRHLSHPAKREGLSVKMESSTDQSLYDPHPRFILPATLLFIEDSLSLTALLDYGCEQTLIFESIVQQCRLETIPPQAPLKTTPPQTFTTHYTLHQAPSTYHLWQPPWNNVILHFLFITLLYSSGIWLAGQTQPTSQLTDCRIEAWSTNCISSCLQSAIPPSPSPGDSPMIEPLEVSHKSQGYLDLWQVFSKFKASSLSPHRPFDCAINLLPGAPLPSSHFYKISRP